MGILDDILRMWRNSKDVTSVTLADVFGNAITAIFYLSLAGLIGTESYGKIGYILAIATIISVIARVGSTNTLIVFGAKQIKIQSSVFFISLVFGLIASVISFALFSDVSMSIIIIGYVIFAISTSDLLGHKAYSTYFKYTISQKLLMVVLSVGLYYSIGFTGILFGIGLSFLPYTHRIYQVFKQTKIDFKLLKEKFRFMINSYILELSNTVISSLDKIVIAPLFGFMILGNYYLAIQFLTVGYIIPNSVFKYILSHDASGTSVIKIKKIGFITAITLSLSGIVFAPIILPTLFPEFKDAIVILQIISLAIIPNYVGLMFISKYLGLEKNNILIIGSGIYLTLHISGIIILGNTYGVNGIAASIVIAESIQCIYFITINRLIKKY